MRNFLFRKVSSNDKNWRSFNQENEGDRGTLEDLLDLTTGINIFEAMYGIKDQNHSVSSMRVCD